MTAFLKNALAFEPKHDRVLKKDGHLFKKHGHLLHVNKNRYNTVNQIRTTHDVGEKERCRKIHHPVELINQQLNPPMYEMYVKTENTRVKT